MRILLKIYMGSRETAQRLKALATLPGDLGLVPSIHVVTQPSVTPVQGGMMSSSDLFGHQACPQCTDTHTCNLMYT